jgi:hypothetical protein
MSGPTRAAARNVYDPESLEQLRLEPRFGLACRGGGVARSYAGCRRAAQTLVHGRAARFASAQLGVRNEETYDQPWPDPEFALERMPEAIQVAHANAEQKAKAPRARKTARRGGAGGYRIGKL